MHITKMTRKELEQVPEYKGDKWGETVLCESLVILPQTRKHDSGYRCMAFVAVRKGEPICRMSGYSDVLHIDGIGGFGHNWPARGRGVPATVPAAGWQIDCLPKSGLLNLWPTNTKQILVEIGGSSWEIYAVKPEATND